MISYVFAGVTITWSGHAIKRAKSRFKHDVKIENEAIVWTFLRTKDETFQVRSNDAIFICKRNGGNRLVIKTCYPSKWKPSPRKPKKVKVRKIPKRGGGK